MTSSENAGTCNVTSNVEPKLLNETENLNSNDEKTDNDATVDLDQTNIYSKETQDNEDYDNDNILNNDKQKIGSRDSNQNDEIDEDKTGGESESVGWERDSKTFANIPLFEVIRPNNLKELVGQKHLINDHNGMIKNFIRLGYLPSMILHGPPGVGKTSMASILAQETGYVFVELSATDATVGDLRGLLSMIEGENRKRHTRGIDYLRVVVFIDEIHRFSTVQQDFLLPFIESGLFTFIGATTLEPKVRLRRAIISRCQVFELKALDKIEIEQVIRKGILYENIRRRLLNNLRSLSYDDDCLNLIIKRSNSDTRAAVNLVELISTRYNLIEYKYDIGKHENFKLDLDALKMAVENLKINLSGLQHTENVNLFLKLYDSMRNITKLRAEEHSFVQDESHINNFSVNRAIRDHASDISKVHPAKMKPKTKVTIERPKEESLIIRLTFPGEETRHRSSRRSHRRSHKKRNSDKLTDLEKSYVERMAVSDDSDVEPGPLYSDCEEDVKLYEMNTISRIDYYAVSAINSLLKLLDRDETPFFIGKQLILFTAVYIKSDNTDMGKTMAMLKSFKYSNTDAVQALSNCVERLTRIEKLQSNESHTFIRKLRYAKEYCYEQLRNKNRNHIKHDATPYGEDAQIIFDSHLVDELLTPVKIKSKSAIAPIFEIVTLDSLKDASKEFNHLPQNEE